MATDHRRRRARRSPGEVVVVLAVTAVLVALVALAGSALLTRQDPTALTTAERASTDTETATPTASPAAPRSSTAPATIAPTTAAPTTTTSAPTTTTPSPPGRTGVFVAAPGTTGVVGTGRLVTYSVEVEEAVGADPAQVAAIIDLALADSKGWTADRSTSFQRLPTGGLVRIVLATPATVDELCRPLSTKGVYSCRRGNQMNINALRWANGTDQWPLDVDAYRAHVINHEMGHVLGHDHLGCPGPGQLAPVMMQQTKGLDGCRANVWPFPDGPPAG